MPSGDSLQTLTLTLTLISIAEIDHSQRKVSDIDMTVKQQQVTIAA